LVHVTCTVQSFDFELIDTGINYLKQPGKLAEYAEYLLLFPTLIPLSGVGTTSFSSCCDKDSAIVFTTGRLPDVNSP
jgi:hypothetical protein